MLISIEILMKVWTWSTQLPTYFLLLGTDMKIVIEPGCNARYNLIVTADDTAPL